MSSNIKANILFYLSSTREKARVIAIDHDLNLKNELIIKLLIKNCRFKFDLLLMENLKSNYSEFKFENVYSFFDKFASNEIDVTEPVKFNERLTELKQSIRNVYPESCLIIDSINLLQLNLNPNKLNRFINHILSKYCKVIFLFNYDLLDYQFEIEELCSAYFKLTRKSLHRNEIHVKYLYKKKCAEFGLNLIKRSYSFTFDSNTLLTKLVDTKKDEKFDNQLTDDYSYDRSFNSIIKDETEEREQTVLPFMRAQHTSKVYYVPDKFDDIDEEDPDDDLLI